MKIQSKSIFIIFCVFLTVFTAFDGFFNKGFNPVVLIAERKITKPLPSLFWSAYMDKCDKNNHYTPIWERLKIKPDPEVLKIEEECRQKYLDFRQDVQKLLKLAYTGSKYIKQSAMIRLRVILNSYGLQRIRSPDIFMPYGPEQLLSQGNILILVQADGKGWFIPADSLLTGGLVLGPQQAGKSRFIAHLCIQIQKANPNTVITIIDPKGGFIDYAPLINADCLDLQNISFDLKPPAGVEYDNFVFEYMPILCDGANLIYSTEIVNDAAVIALKQREQYIQTIYQNTELCLKDIYGSISLVSNASSGRRFEYKQAAETALHRIIGNRNLFACRRGVSIEKLFSKNTILVGRCLTDDLECRTLLSYFLYYKYQQSRYLPETNKLQHLIIVDDAARFLGTADYTGTSKRISPTGHILALLRSTGTGLISATQLPGFLDPSVIALSRFMTAIGPISGKENLDVVRNFMSLNPEQTAAVTKLSAREAVAFAPNTAFKGVVHGWVPYVETPPVRKSLITSEDYQIEPWHHLMDIPAQKTEPVTKLDDAPTGHDKQLLSLASNKTQFSHPETKRLIYDCVCYPFHSVTARVKRLGISGRNFESAKVEGCEKGYLITTYAGSTLYLIPTQLSFDLFDAACPYRRTTSIEHAFYVALGCFLLEKDPRYQSVKPEFPIGNTGSASDIVTVGHEGLMHAWEVCLGTNYVLANVAKYKNTSFSKVFLLSRDYELSLAIQKLVKFSELETQLLEKLEYMHFSQLLHLQRKLSKF